MEIKIYFLENHKKFGTKVKMEKKDDWVNDGKRHRHWVFTAWDEKEPKFTKEMTYLAYAAEICPTTGTHHWQGYVGFPNAVGLNGAIKKLQQEKHPRLAARLGSLASNEVYCSKEGKLIKHGTFPTEQGKRTDLEDVRDEILAGKKIDEIVMEKPMLVHQYGRTLTMVEDICMRKKYRTKMTKGIWYWGPTGVGKSHMAFKGFTPETHYVHNVNDGGWWDAYRQQPVVIINEFRGQIQFGELIDLLDKWPKTVKRRNREPIPFTSELVIITSCAPPTEVYMNVLKGEEKLDQLTRRCEIVHMPTKSVGDSQSGTTPGTKVP